MALKKFYKVMEGGGETYPDKVEWFDAKIRPKERTRPNPLNEEQIREIVEQCQNDRDRAMYKVLYEEALRPSDIAEELEVHRTTISKRITDLAEEELVKVMNPGTIGTGTIR